MIYFVRKGEDGPIKIGKTIDLDKRLPQLKAEFGLDLRVMATLDETKFKERELHERFSAFWIGREWFVAAEELLGLIAQEGQAWKPRDETTVKMDRKLASTCRWLAEDKGVTLCQYLSEMVGPAIDAAFREAIEKDDI